MSRANGIFLGFMLLLALCVAGWKVYTGEPTGTGYYEQRRDGKRISLDRRQATIRMAEIELLKEMDPQAYAKYKDSVHFSLPRTIGIWVAAFFTLAMLSFLYKDNPLYKIAEHAFVGVSAAYWMTIAFWAGVVPNLLGKLFPRWTKTHLLPGLDLDQTVETLAAQSWLQKGESVIGVIDYEAADGDGLTATVFQLMNVWYWVPVILGVMLLWRLAPKGGWIARWPLAYILGTTAGLRLVGFLESDFLAQIKSTILPVVDRQFYATTGALDGPATFLGSLNNIIIIVGVFCGLAYFFFSLEHKGLIGRASRVGIWLLMITFGAGFGYTVMGRVALLVGRFEFFLIDWLNVVPP